MKDSRYDIKTWSRPAPNFARDLAHGKEGEAIVESFLDALHKGSFEVKYDRYRNGRMVVETEQNPRNTGWKPSGLKVTKAKWWVYMFSPNSFVIVGVPRLKKYIKAHKSSLERRDFAAGSNNPARGYLLYPEHVQEMMNSSDYD